MEDVIWCAAMAETKFNSVTEYWPGLPMNKEDIAQVSRVVQGQDREDQTKQSQAAKNKSSGETTV